MVTHPPAPLSPLSLEQSKASHQALAILDDVQAWHEAGHENGGAVGGHPGDGVPGDDSRVAGHAVKPGGTSNYRNVVGVSVATARTAHSSRAGDTAVPKNLVVSARALALARRLSGSGIQLALLDSFPVPSALLASAFLALLGAAVLARRLPAPPAACLLSAGSAAKACLGTPRPEPAFAALQQATAAAIGTLVAELLFLTRWQR